LIVVNHGKTRPTISRRTAKCFRCERVRRARILLDQAYEEFLRETRRNSLEREALSQQELSAPEELEVLQELELASPAPPEEPETPHGSKPGSPAVSISSLIIYRITSVSPPLSVPNPSYSPVPLDLPTSNLLPSSANSTSSVKFLEEIELLPRRPRYYYYNGLQNSFEEMKQIEQFPMKKKDAPLVEKRTTTTMKSGSPSDIGEDLLAADLSVVQKGR
jgi:hypothetical protein